MGGENQMNRETTPHSLDDDAVRAIGRKRLAFVACVAALLVVIVFAGWRYVVARDDQASRAALMPHVKTASIYAASIIDIHAHPGSATFGEVFKKVEASLTEIDKVAIQARAGTSQANPYLEPSLEYIRDLEEFIRSTDKVVRATFDGSTAWNRVERVHNMPGDSSYAIEFKLQQIRDAQRDLEKSLADTKTAVKITLLQLERIRVQQPWVSQTFGADATIPSASIEALAKRLKDMQATAAK